MLQKVDPLDRKLGNNIYWFYVEPPSLAPLFLGPLQAGADLGDIVVGPLLEASGEVRGTPEELAAFSAEWDQPGTDEARQRRNRLVLRRVEAARSQTGRRQADFPPHRTPSQENRSIISPFKQGGKPISHVYSRREPKRRRCISRSNWPTREMTS